MSTKRSFFLIASLLLGITLLTIWLALDTRAVGAHFVINGEAIEVVRVAESGPAAGLLSPGQRLSGYLDVNGEPVSFNQNTLLEEPDFIIDYADFNAFFDEQDRIAQALQQEQISFITDDGLIHVDTVERPLSSLPFIFWFQIISGLTAAITGSLVWMFRPRLASARFYALTGIFHLMVTYTAAIYSGRELALDGELFFWLSSMDHLGAMIFSASFISLLWHYPERLNAFPIHWVAYPVFFLVWLGDVNQWLPNTDYAIRIPIIVGLLLSLIIGAYQWRKTRGNPVTRTALKWFLFALLFSGASFVSLIFVTVWLGFDAAIPQGYAFGLISMMYLGIALGILRYRLFDLDRWWFNVWLWLVSGALVVAGDLTMVYLLRINPNLALAISLVLVGWMYFPLRQWLLRRILPSSEPKLEKLFPQLLRLGLTANDQVTLSKNWQELLRELFHPLSIDTAPDQTQHSAIHENGLSLHIPPLGSLPATKISYPSNGNRLFGASDAELAQGLWNIAQNAIDDRHAYETGVKSERERIYQDMHDDLGAKLLTIIHRVKENETSDIARSALQDLRDIVSSDARGPVYLNELMELMHDECDQRLQHHELALHWSYANELPELLLSADISIHLKRMLRETVSNAIHHSQGTQLNVNVGSDDQQLHLDICDNGVGMAQPRKGRGMANIRKRAERIGANVNWTNSPTGGVCCRIELPIPPD